MNLVEHYIVEIHRILVPEEYPHMVKVDLTYNCHGSIQRGWHTTWATAWEQEKVGIVLSIVFPSLIILFGLANSIFGWSFEFTQQEKLDWFNRNENAYTELQMYNHKEFGIRDEWRENHPFEEKVRKALESKNGKRKIH